MHNCLQRANQRPRVGPLFCYAEGRIVTPGQQLSHLTGKGESSTLPTPRKPPENCVVLDATPRFPLKAGVSVADRNRADLRFIEGGFSWRYRNRLMVERSFRVHSYHFTPYVRGEAYYDSKPAKWSRTTEDIGCVFPIRRRAEIESYYEHMNDTSKSPNRQTHGVGVTLSLYF